MPKLSSWVTWIGLVLVGLGSLSQVVSPATFRWLAPFGLTFGAGWLLLLVGTCWRLLQFQWLNSLLPGVVLVVTWSSFSLVFSLGAGGVSDEEVTKWQDKSLSVLTFNVRRLDEFGWLQGDQTRKDIARWLGERDEAIWCFQEFPSNGQRVLQNAGFSFQSSNRTLVSWSNGSGPAIASKYKVIHSDEPKFSASAGKGRVKQADVVVKEDTIRIFSVHLQSLHMNESDYKAVDEGPNQREGFRLLGLVSSASAARAQQAQELKKWMDDSPFPVIVAGDFNDVPMSYAMRILRSNGVHDTFEASGIGFGGTHIGTVPGMRIDAILADESMKVLKHETHDVVLSDHRPVTAIIGLNN